MPNYFRTSKVVDDINNANAIELDNFDKKLDSVANQFFVNSADFALERWEKEFGIAINNNYDTSFRRSVILSKIRGQGTITVKLIENVAESFENGEVDVIENNSDYSFKITFVGTKGIPPNLSDLMQAIEEIKPAHLAVIFEYAWQNWNEIDVKNSTWDNIDTYNMSWDIFETGAWN
jgi:uncharacterized protein YmfQ (DUF2313 family)